MHKGGQDMIADLKSYPAMKNSGVPWLAESFFAKVVALIQPKLSTLLRVLSWMLWNSTTYAMSCPAPISWRRKKTEGLLTQIVEGDEK
jgi:hypothetical protein